MVADVRRYAVKSMLGEALEAGAFDAGGPGRRPGHALVDDETGKVVSVKRPTLVGAHVRADRVDGRRAPPAGPSWSRSPTGPPPASTIPSCRACSARSSGDRCRSSTDPPADATFDEVWLRDLKAGAEPYFGAPSRVEDGEEMVDGGSEMGPHGNLFNYGTVHVVTTSTTDALARAAPDSRFDPHRFRPNLVVETPDDGLRRDGVAGAHAGDRRRATAGDLHRARGA